MPDATSSITPDIVFAEIARVLRDELQLAKAIQPTDDLAADLQLDSVSLLTLVVELENRFRVALNEEDAADIHTVAELAALVVRRTREST
jgi:acyl carrier protein